MNLTELSKAVHAANIKWWQDPATGLPIKRNKGELLALIHSEVSEALEGERKNLQDDKLPEYPMAALLNWWTPLFAVSITSRASIQQWTCRRFMKRKWRSMRSVKITSTKHGWSLVESSSNPRTQGLK